VGGKHLLLLLQHARYFLLEGEELLLVVAPHRPLHSVDVLPHLLLILTCDDVLHLDLFLDPVGLLCRSDAFRCRDGLLYRLSSILILFWLFGNLLDLPDLFYLFYFLRYFFWWSLSGLWRLFLLSRNI
jgi:hypothetical protein